MRYGKFLPKNGTIGFVAPSFGCNMEPYKTAFLNAQKKWEEAGYTLDLGPNCYAGEGVGISNTPALCGQELTAYYNKEETDILISCGGGELMCEILEFVDWEAIAAAPAKWYMGFSDNTNATYLLATIADTASIYGPCAATFGQEPPHKSLADAFSILTGTAADTPVITLKGYPTWELEGVKDAEHPLAGYNLTEEKVLSLYRDGRLYLGEEIEKTAFSGRLIGGCMDCLVNLLGTRFDKTAEFLEKYREDGFVWFLEACDLNVFAIRRAMWQMEMAGWFRYVKGFVIGRPLAGLEPMFGLDRFEAVLAMAGRHGVPVLFDADLGHRPPMLPLIVGSYATVQVEKNELTVRMELR